MIGIDLGTTNSLVAVLTGGKPRVLANELGESLTPSVVAVAEDGTILTGRAARDRLVADPISGQAFFKRDMGSRVSYSFGGKSWTPVECSAVVLREMKRIAETHLGHEVTRAVITVPAYFHDQQRQATLAAAKIAGLEVERLVNEPTAAALAYGFQRPDDDSTLLVFDLGGGTFDVTLLEVFDGVVEVKASAGESRLGGEDYTDALSAWICREHDYVPEPGQTGRWRARLEGVKRELSAVEECRLPLGDREVTVTREDFARACEALTARLQPVVRRCLRDGGVTPQHLTAVLLVGGASRMPLVRELLQDDLKMSPREDLDPDRVVALGAAVQQALCEGNEAVQDIVLTDVCSHTLGIAVAKWLGPNRQEPGYFEPLIDRNTTVPVSRSKTFSTMHPEQDEVKVQVFQGEGRRTADNTFLGDLIVRGLRSAGSTHSLAGSFEIRFTYDMSGLLEVEVTNAVTGKKDAKVFEERPGVMTAAQIAAAIARLAPLKVHPRDLPPHRARIERAARLFTQLSGQLRQSLSEVLDDFERSLEAGDSAWMSRAAESLDQFMAPWFTGEDETRD
jgi:molecular chaperone HscC